MVTEAPPEIIKSLVRTEALARRDAMDADARAAASETIATRGLPVQLRAGMVVSGFMPIRSEINPMPLLRQAAAMGATLALPAIQGRGRPLVMRAWSIGAPLERRQWGIREPAADAPEVFPDIVLTPLAAFDRHGYRVGYGAGYFDMTLNALRMRKPVIALGIAFACQEVDRAPIEPHDARLDFVLTENETIRCEV